MLLAAEGSSALLGPVLRWAAQHEVSRLVLLVEGADAGVVTRRVRLLNPPAGLSVEVVLVAGSSLDEAVAADRSAPPDLGADVWALASLINESGARAVDDHGRLVAELAGLEVARVVRIAGGRPVLEVGVGQADRELHQLVHRDLAPDAALRRAVAAVAVHRHAGALPHPLNRVARERWLRSALLDDPGLLGLASLDPEPPLEPRATVLGNRPVAAVGRSARTGELTVVVCSTGVDLDLAPQAADYRDRIAADAPLIVVVPPMDRYRVTEELVSMIPRAVLHSVASPWEGPAADTPQ